ncbi:hypothetical protein [Nocardiopsis sp. TSRI0078]|nr:hypothetical protein [Nocardiopsis sp. TSRI0078]
MIAYSGFLWREECSLVDYLLRVTGGATRLPWLVEGAVPDPAGP